MCGVFIYGVPGRTQTCEGVQNIDLNGQFLK